MKVPGLVSVADDFFDTCDQEPIHIPGSIQPHGVLLAFSASSGRLCFASENVSDFLAVSNSSLADANFEYFAGECSVICFRQFRGEGAGGGGVELSVTSLRFSDLFRPFRHSDGIAIEAKIPIKTQRMPPPLPLP